jgi:MSHA biogenesis protein MshG
MAIQLNTQYEFLLMMSHANQLHQTLYESLKLTVNNSPKSIQTRFKPILIELEQGKTWTQTMYEMATFFSNSIVYGWIMLDHIHPIKDMLTTMMTLLKDQMLTQSQLKKSLRYPTILIVMLVIITMVFIGVIYPQFEVLNNMYDISLPNWIRHIIHHWKTIRFVLVVIFSVISLHVVLNHVVLFYKKWCHTLIGKIPILNHYQFEQHIRNIALIFSFILSDDTHLSTHLNQVKYSIISPSIKKNWQFVLSLIEEGNTIGSALKQAGYPSLMTSLVEVGEKQGTLDKMFHYIYEVYALKHKKRVEKRLAYLEPLLIFMISSVVFLMAYLMYGTLMNMYDSIGNLR